MSNDLQHTCRTHISSGLQENPSHLGGGGGGGGGEGARGVWGEGRGACTRLTQRIWREGVGEG